MPPCTASAAADTTWLKAHQETLKFALFVMPYAGIGFLWFVGVLRDKLGTAEDRFLATVFYGSGLLFLGMTFLATALMGGLLLRFEALPERLMPQGGLLVTGWSVIYQVFQLYSIRTAAVFISSLGTIWFRTKVINRACAVITYGLSLVLMHSVSFFLGRC